MSRPFVSNGNIVSFVLQDVVSPDLRPLFEHVGPSLRVCGQIVFMSDGGADKDRFAVVEIDGIYTPLIVPVACLSCRGTGQTAELDGLVTSEPECGNDVPGNDVLSCGSLAGDVDPGRDVP